MEFYKDLLIKPEKSIKIIIFGFAMSAFASAWLIRQYTNNDPISLFDWLFFTVFITNGLINGLKGFGYNISFIFGRAYVEVNMDNISIKASAFEPENIALWEDIENIEYKPTRFRITKKDLSEQRLCMRKLDYNTIQDMKVNVELLAKEKSIPYTQIEQ
jgi:hypothetical protein